ncbi:MAG: hypothetical protein AB7P22_00735, partial [Vicinamibacterales bacterium]
CGVDHVNINRVRPVGRGASVKGSRPSAEQIDESIRRAWARVRPGEAYPFESAHTTQSTCGVGRFVNILPNGDVYPCHVLTQREFMCGNVREGVIGRLYSDGSLLSRLLAVRFESLAELDPQLQPLQAANTCMGTVYAETRNSKAWSEVIAGGSGSRFKMVVLRESPGVTRDAES